MAEFLYDRMSRRMMHLTRTDGTKVVMDRMSRRMRRLALFGMLAIYLSIVGAIIYITAHFVAKFW